MKEVIAKAREKIETLQDAINLVKENEDFFDNLDVNIALDGNGITMWCKGDAREIAQILANTFGLTFTRKRVTDNCYDWVSEINSVPIVLNMVEYTQSDLTGTLAPL